MALGFVGAAVAAMEFDYAVVLRFSDGSEVRVETEFTLQSGSGQPEHVVPGDDSARLRTSRLRGTRVNEATVESSGRLRLLFNDGTLLQVPPDEEYEAWTSTGPHGELVVCGPGGLVSDWGARS
ncbi:DUF6188 family protein [Actinokineospora inagensis]|uniref:DUF6188 family protein n=1 Tax=Actinokineospora inagensis TaxID=103730 RepID=UPI0003F75633|nr:DUF6188 family protein [Actinokineospora inagensis]